MLGIALSLGMFFSILYESETDKKINPLLEEIDGRLIIRYLKLTVERFEVCFASQRSIPPKGLWFWFALCSYRP